MSASATLLQQKAPFPAFVRVQGNILLRKCACGGPTSLAGECAECSKKRMDSVSPISSQHKGGPTFGHDFAQMRVHANASQLTQRKAVSTQAKGGVPPIVHDVLRSPGQPLEPAARTFMESRFGHDFGKVRVRTDARAGASAQALKARAYTVGQDVVFGAGQYAPGTQEGRLLLAHELTHVIQQDAAVVDTPTVQRDDDKSEGDKKGERKSEAKAATWTRKRTNGPRLLDGDKPSYQVWFDHILPPVPKGVTQMWQVVEDTTTFLTNKCEEKTEKAHVVDIVDISNRTNINDNWGWIREDDPCFVVQVSQATIGFDDQKSGLAEQTSQKVTEKLAKDVLKKMAGPKGTYSGTYTFVKSANCKDCSEKLKKLQDKQKTPNGETLVIEGVGSWTS